VWHFAFKAKNPAFDLWTPYGFIEWREDSLALFHYRGHNTMVNVPHRSEAFVAETWFGEGPAEFRVASLHDSELSLDRNAHSPLPCVRFP